MKALWYTGPQQAELRTQPWRPDPAQVQVQSLHSAISRGTESLVWRAQVPPALHQEMRAPFQQGAFSGAVKYGYCSVGRVLASPEPSLPVGQRVFCLYPHQDRYQVPAAALTAIPGEVPSRRAVLAANVETALNAVWDAQPGPGDRISVVGCGVVGALVAWLCAQLPQTTVQVVDLNPERRALAESFGTEFRGTEEAEGGQDLVIHSSASSAGLSLSLALCAVEARVVELSWYGTQSPSVPLGGAFHSKRLSIVGSQVGRIPAHRAARWSYARRMQTVMALLADPALDALLEPGIPFERLPAALPGILGAPGRLCQVIDYPKDQD
ncbi:MAG: zinc-binding alcohol dehydrogenase [Myxococcota bacterium]|nr:zinc-binding alcohol dehydrogenase [Myxococcota bacterium]